MTRGAWMSMLIGILCVIAAFASISGIENPGWRTAALAASLFLLAIGAFGYFAISINIFTAWQTFIACKKLGISRVYTHGELCSDMPTRIEKAREIRVMAVTALALLRANEDQFRKALALNAAHIRVLIAAPESNFMKDTEHAESETRSGHGSAESRQVDDLLREFIRYALAVVGPNRPIGKISRAYYRTELRGSILTCDNSWGWYTINLPPRRARQMPSIELITGQEAILEDCIAHFERVWKICEAEDKVDVMN